MATWNLTHRARPVARPYGIEINGNPLVFYHFSGFDSGDQKVMLDRYGSESPVLYELRDWYLARCEELGQSHLGNLDCVYNSFSNGAADHKRPSSSVPAPCRRDAHLSEPFRRESLRAIILSLV